MMKLLGLRMAVTVLLSAFLVFQIHAQETKKVCNKQKDSKGKDALPQFTPPGLSTKEEREDKPTPPAPKAPAPTQAPVRMEPSIDPISSPVIATGYGGKPAPVQPPHPEIN